MLCPKTFYEFMLGERSENGETPGGEISVESSFEMEENASGMRRYEEESVYLPQPSQSHLVVYAAICITGLVLLVTGLHFYWVCYYAYLSCIDESRVLATQNVSVLSAVSILSSHCASISIVDFVIFALLVGTPATYFAALLLILQLVSTFRQVPRITLDISGVTVNTLFGSNSERWINLGEFTLLDDAGSLIEAPIILTPEQRAAKSPETMTIKASAVDVDPVRLLEELNQRRRQAINPSGFDEPPARETPTRSFGRRIVSE